MERLQFCVSEQKTNQVKKGTRLKVENLKELFSIITLMCLMILSQLWDDQCLQMTKPFQKGNSYRQHGKKPLKN